MERVFKEAITSGECIVLATQDGTIGQDQFLEEVEVVVSRRVTYVNGATGDGTRSGMEVGARVGGLEHVPIRVNEVSHP